MLNVCGEIKRFVAETRVLDSNQYIQEHGTAIEERNTTYFVEPLNFFDIIKSKCIMQFGSLAWVRT